MRDQCKTPLPDWVAKTARDRRASELMRTTARAFESYRDPERVRFLHLVDGGVTDNFGLSPLIMMRRAATTPFAPFTPRDAVRVRRMTFLVVNAEQTPSERWAMTQEGPNGIETLSAAMDGAINTSKRRAYDAFRDTIAAWERDVRAYRCALPKAKAAELSPRPQELGLPRRALRRRHDLVRRPRAAQGDRLGADRNARQPPRRHDRRADRRRQASREDQRRRARCGAHELIEGTGVSS